MKTRLPEGLKCHGEQQNVSVVAVTVEFIAQSKEGEVKSGTLRGNSLASFPHDKDNPS